MKKFLVLTLLLLLVLSSCSRDKAAKTDEFIIKGGLPDIGEFSGNNAKGHFHGEYTEEFIPSDEYGTIIPYIGNYKKFSISDSDSIAQGYLSYGFCTMDGQIVLDASSRNTHISTYETEDGFCYYTLFRETERIDADQDAFYYSEISIIPKSGEWCVILPVGAWVSSAGNGVISVCHYPQDGGKPVHYFYDYSGNEISVLPGYDSIGEYSHGMMAVSVWDRKYIYNEHSYIDINGEAVLGPYNYASDFNSYGIAAVCDTNDEYYLIDTDGKRLTSEDYDNFISGIDEKGETRVLVARHKNNTRKADVFDLEGNLLGTAEGGTYFTFRFPQDGEIIYGCRAIDNSMVWRRLSDGSHIVSSEYGFEPNEFDGGDDIFIHLDSENTATFISSCGETVLTVEEYYGYIGESDDGRYIAYSTGELDYSYEGDSYDNKSIVEMHVYDVLNKKEVFKVSDFGHIAFFGENDRYIYVETFIPYVMFDGESEQYLYDTVEGRMLFEKCKNITCYSVDGEDFISVCTTNTCTLYNSKNEIIIKQFYE